MSGWWAASYVVLWALVIMLCVVVVALARQIGTLHLRLGPVGALEIDDEGPPLGEAPEPIEARTLDGDAISVGGPGHPQMLLFVSPGCRICRDVLPGLPAAASAHGFTPVIVAGEHYGAPEEIDPTKSGTKVIASAEVMSGYNIPGTPYAVVIDRGGIVRGKGTVNSLEQLEGLAETARRREVGASDHPAR